MPFNEQILLILTSSLVVTIIFRRFKLPPIIAYIVAGTILIISSQVLTILNIEPHTIERQLDEIRISKGNPELIQE